MMDGPDPHITPETPGRPAIRNPFESPNDYHHLHESLVPSPSVFKTRKPSGATPAKFSWSIDDMASMHPVHIDAEDIHRQSLYFSQSRTDTEIEEKRQNAIEQFFTKEAIVPSPWAGPANKQSLQLHAGKSPLPQLILEEPLITKKNNVSCQTTLSLPVGLDVEKILAAYCLSEELCDQVQESLSTSSLRRKLFLDGQGSGSDSSNPSSPEREASCAKERPPGGGQEGGRPLSSPFSCGITAITPSTGQFSSSPIQGRGRAYSLGNGASPLFPDKSSPAAFKSPTLSPIGPEATTTPQGAGERKKLSFVTPEAAPLEMEVNAHTESPYVEGCSPIRSCSPLQPQGRTRANPRSRARCWASPPRVSPILNPKLLENQNVLWLPPSPLPVMEMEPCSPSPGLARLGETPGCLEPIQMEEAGEEEDELVAAEEEEEGVASVCLTSSRMGSALAVDTSHMFVSLLAEGSCIPTDSSSMQVDSGYNTYSVSAASLIDGASSDCQSKESFSTHPTEETYSRHTRNRAVYPHH
ncbi:protein aurora borealis [Osmerus eperlanus]|uniref:protein aurora borealis n=1 Tax=Osmerus eperlanus TaxID=29151 RepID=UPI002E138816